MANIKRKHTKKERIVPANSHFAIFYLREGDEGTRETKKEPEKKKETDQEALLRILSNPGIWQIPYVCSAFIIIRHNCNLD